MSVGKLIGGIGIGVALGAAGGVYVLAPNLGAPSVLSSEKKSDTRNLEHQLRTQEASLSSANEVLKRAEKQIVDAKLVDTTVAVVIAPSVDHATVDEMIRVITQAGGKIGAQIRLTDKAVSTQGADGLKSLVTKTLPQGTQLSEDNLAPGMHTGQLLAAIFSEKTSASDRAVALGALGKEGYVTYEGEVKPSTVVSVLVAGDTAAGQAKGAQDKGDRAAQDHKNDKGDRESKGDHEHKNDKDEKKKGAQEHADAQHNERHYSADFLTNLALGLKTSPLGVAVGGTLSTAAPTGVIGQLRGLPQEKNTVSTVDNIDTVAGRISFINVLASARGKDVIHAGSGEKAAKPAA